MPRVNGRVGSPIFFRGEYEGKKYEDKGTIIAFEPEKRLQYTHYSPMGGKPDKPENYHNVTYLLEPSGQTTKVALTQDGNADDDARDHAAKNWSMMLEQLKACVEG